MRKLAVKHFEFFRDVAKMYRWRLRANNGKVLADCGQGYRTRADCMNAMYLVMGTDTLTPIEFL